MIRNQGEPKFKEILKKVSPLPQILNTIPIVRQFLNLALQQMHYLKKTHKLRMKNLLRLMEGENLLDQVHLGWIDQENLPRITLRRTKKNWSSNKQLNNHPETFIVNMMRIFNSLWSHKRLKTLMKLYNLAKLRQKSIVVYKEAKVI